MTKEELEKEAEEYANNLAFVFETDIVQRIVRERVRLALIDVLEPREKRIEELEAEVKEWKDKADLWCKTANLKDHNIMINKELEKENAELKGLVNQYKASKCSSISLVNRNMIMFDQLTKAKEIIKAFLDSSDLNIKHKAEEFLGEF